MTRNQLRKILENEVKLDSKFQIIICDWDSANIKIIFPKEIQDSYLSILNNYDNQTDIRNNLEYGRYNSKVHKYIKNCCKQLEKKGFTILQTMPGSIDFKYPKKYQIKRDTYSDSWMDEPHNADEMLNKMTLNKKPMY